MTNRPTRRRLLAISAGLLGTGLGSTPTLAQSGSQPKLPDCEAKATFGEWNAYVTDIDGFATQYGRMLPAEVRSASFKYDYSKSSTSYTVDFTLTRPPASAYFDVEVAVSDGARSKASLAPKKMTKQSGNRHEVIVDVSNWFREPNNPLRRGASATIAISNSGAQLFSMEVQSYGFTLASEFLQKELVRLDQMEKAKQCEGDCFLTTACCELIGLDGDCFELRTLRAFRDGPLAATPGGKEDIALYYHRAPLILAEMSRRGDSRRLLQLYATHILPSVLAATLRLDGLARALYTDMMARLERRYLGVRG